MSVFEKKISKTANKIYTKIAGLSQDKTLKDAAEASPYKGMPALLRRAAGEGAVLLKNDGALPLSPESCISVFGRVQADWFYTGYGSGGDVNFPYAVNLIEGLRNSGSISFNEPLAKRYEAWCAENKVEAAVWGMWPRFLPEMPITAGEIAEAAKVSQTAVMVIGRSSGEDRENALEKGSYYLTDEEKSLIDSITASFEKTILVFNIGSVMDFAFLKDYGDKISAVLIVWQGGMESGNAVADILSGKVNPSGKLTDTIAKTYECYPSSKDFGGKEFNNYTEDIYVGYRYFETFNPDYVLYPFGFGMSYTDFEYECSSAEVQEDCFCFEAEVRNTGRVSGRETLQLYVEKPCGSLGNPSRELVDFAKTSLIGSGESERLLLSASLYQLSSYDESGLTGFKSAYVMEKGEYNFYIGSDVRSAERVYSYYQENAECILQLSECSAPVEKFDVITAVEGKTAVFPIKRSCKLSSVDLRQKILDNLPPAIEQTGDKGYKLSQVKSGEISLDKFVAQLSNDELEAITKGDYTMDSPLGAKGNAGALGGVCESLRDKGVPPMITTDGPSGIRLSASCSLIPIGTLLASTFDTDLVCEVYSAIAAELESRGSDILLAPGMNIHRNVLCGRNFEYYSEDPLLTGKIAAAAVCGIQSRGASACPKHFALNNQEWRRNTNDSRVSERALREIYLKGFEICVKEAAPKNIMTSYNKINGVWGHYNYELCTSILRGEWGYKGNVMTDWWMKSSKSPEFPNIKNQAYRVRAQIDVLMPGGKRTGKRKPDGTLLATLGKADGITLGELQRSAKNVLSYILSTNKLDEAAE